MEDVAQSSDLYGARGLSSSEVLAEIEAGARVIQFTYVVSIVVLTFSENTRPRLIRPGPLGFLLRLIYGLPYTVSTALFGWWGFPWGPLFTIYALFSNLVGGEDITEHAVSSLTPDPRIGWHTA